MRTRTIVETRKVPHTIDGVTILVDEPYEITVPVPPRDWDHIVLTTVTGVVAFGLAVCIAWSTASIGDLLARAVTEPIAYAAASAFSLGWAVCMALEWLARHDPDRARRPRTAGHWALIADMAAVCAHGYMADSLQVGIAGAAVSALAKGLWTLALAQTGTPLDDRTRQWLVQRQAQIGARLALGAQTRRLDRAEQHATLLAPPAVQPRQDTQEATPAVSGTTRSAVLAARATMPDASVEDIVTTLTALGLDTDEDTVSRVLDTQDSRSDGRVLALARPGQSVADTIRTALASGVQDKDKLDAYAESLHPDIPKATIVRTRNRVLGEKRPA